MFRQIPIGQKNSKTPLHATEPLLSVCDFPSPMHRAPRYFFDFFFTVLLFAFFLDAVFFGEGLGFFLTALNSRSFGYSAPATC